MQLLEFVDVAPVTLPSGGIALEAYLATNRSCRVHQEAAAASASLPSGGACLHHIPS